MTPNNTFTQFQDTRKHKIFFCTQDVANWVGQLIDPTTENRMKLNLMLKEHLNDQILDTNRLVIESMEIIGQAIKNREYAKMIIKLWLKKELIQVSKTHTSGEWYQVLT